ncbi:unnamed protein product [Lathyrus sativus]|nr:unnamed protein product [Lathyrus sativus]
MSVLVNGSPTEDFRVYHGLRQRDPMPLFHFSIVTEAFAKMVNRASNMGLLKGFKVNDGASYNLLQFADGYHPFERW